MAKDDLPPTIEAAAFVPGHLTVETMFFDERAAPSDRRRLGRSGQPEEIAEAVLLVSTEASYVTHGAVRRDGGLGRPGRCGP